MEGKMSHSTAKRLMQIAEVYGNGSPVSHLNIGLKAMAILSQNSTG
jgi:hypothetical protein